MHADEQAGAEHVNVRGYITLCVMCFQLCFIIIILVVVVSIAIAITITITTDIKATLLQQ